MSVQPKDYSLYSFAYCGNTEGFKNKLEYLADIAEPEKWGFSEQEPLSILKNYVFKTFEQCNKQGKIEYSADRKWCCVNTGLLTPNGKDILMIFNENKKQESPWYLKSFRDCAERDFMDNFTKIPKLASYTDNFEEFYFKPNYNIEINTDHILDDNWERINKEVNLPKNMVKVLLNGVIEETKLKVQRNMRLVVPQFYKDEIMYLMPIRIPVSEDKIVTMALAIEETDTHQYRANTIFTKEMAYEKARLLMKPESNWLIEE